MIGDAIVVDIKRKPMTKKPKMELYPIMKVQNFSNGVIGPKSYWVVIKPDGNEIQCATYDSALLTQQELSSASRLDKKGKV